MIRTTPVWFAIFAAASVAVAEDAVKPATKPAAPSDTLIDVGRGTLPIIFTAPHGGLQDAPGIPMRENRDAYRFVTGADVNTRELAQKIIAEVEQRLGGKPYFVVARFRRRHLDANRTVEHAYEVPEAKFYYDAYHGTIEEFCLDVQKKFGTGLLIDVHGQATYKDELLIGTQGGDTMKLLLQRRGNEALVGERGVVGFLKSAGFNVMPEIGATDFNVPKYNGGYTVIAHGSSQPAGIDAVQFEFGSNYRTKEKLDDTARRAAEAIEKFYNAYLTK